MKRSRRSEDFLTLQERFETKTNMKVHITSSNYDEMSVYLPHQKWDSRCPLHTSCEEDHTESPTHYQNTVVNDVYIYPTMKETKRSTLDDLNSQGGYQKITITSNIDRSASAGGSTFDDRKKPKTLTNNIEDDSSNEGFIHSQSEEEEDTNSKYIYSVSPDSPYILRVKSKEECMDFTIGTPPLTPRYMPTNSGITNHISRLRLTVDLEESEN
jgi:hypothetical protein